MFVNAAAHRAARQKTSRFYTGFLPLEDIPPETFEYCLGNRSALEWVIDQYQVSTDKRSGIILAPQEAGRLALMPMFPQSDLDPAPTCA